MTTATNLDSNPQPSNHPFSSIMDGTGLQTDPLMANISSPDTDSIPPKNVSSNKKSDSDHNSNLSPAPLPDAVYSTIERFCVALANLLTQFPDGSEEHHLCSLLLDELVRLIATCNDDEESANILELRRFALKAISEKVDVTLSHATPLPLISKMLSALQSYLEIDKDSPFFQNPDQAFISPKKTVTIQNSPVQNNVNIQNRFSPLVNETETMDSEISEPKPPKPSRPEAFFLVMANDWKKSIDKIFTHIGNELPKKTIGEFIKIFPQSLDQFHKIKDLIDSDPSIKIYNHSLKSDRPKKVVLYGLPSDLLISKISEALTSHGFNIIEVANMKKYDPQTKTKTGMNMHLISLSPTPNWNLIYNATDILGFHVNVKSYYKKGPRQCFRCQRFNHSSVLCRLPPRCLKCSLGHLTKNCTKPVTEPAKCCLCQGNHTANFQKCPQNPIQLKKSKNLISKRPKTLTNPPTTNPVASTSVPPLSSNPVNSYNEDFPPINNSSPQDGGTSLPIPGSAWSNNNSFQQSSLEETVINLQKILSLLKDIELQCKSMGIEPKTFLLLLPNIHTLVSPNSSKSKTLFQILIYNFVDSTPAGKCH